MKIKNILILLILISPVLGIAQFKLDMSFSTGINEVQIKDGGGPGDHESGFSFKGGIDATYMINSNVGIGSGLFYSYYNVVWELSETDRSSNALSIPLNLIYQIQSSPIEILFGAIANINLNEQFTPDVNTKHEYQPLYMNLQLGGFYNFNKLKLGIIADTGISPYFKLTSLNAAPQYGKPVDKYFLRSLSLKLSYTLFGK